MKPAQLKRFSLVLWKLRSPGKYFKWTLIMLWQMKLGVKCFRCLVFRLCTCVFVRVEWRVAFSRVHRIRAIGEWTGAFVNHLSVPIHSWALLFFSRSVGQINANKTYRINIKIDICGLDYQRYQNWIFCHKTGNACSFLSPPASRCIYHCKTTLHKTWIQFQPELT